MSLLDTIRQKNPSLRDRSDDELKSILRKSPEFTTFSDEQFDRFVSGPAEPKPTEKESPGFTGGLSAGIDQVQGMGGGLMQAAGDALESDYLWEKGRDIYQDNMAEAGENALGYGLTDIRGAGDAWNWARYTAGNLLPTLAVSVAGGGVGGLAGRALAGQVARQTAMKAGQALGAFGASAGMETGAIMGETQDLDVSLAHGALAGSLDALLPFQLLRKAGADDVANQAASEISDNVLRDLRARAAQSGREAVGRGSLTGLLTEASTEGLQGLISQHANYWVENNGESLLNNLDQVDVKAILDEAAAGGLMGGVAGGPTGLIERGQAQTQVDRIELARRQAEAEGGDALDQANAALEAEQEVMSEEPRAPGTVRNLETGEEQRIDLDRPQDMPADLNTPLPEGLREQDRPQPTRDNGTDIVDGTTGFAADDLSPFQRNQLRDYGVTDEQLWDMPTNQALAELDAANRQRQEPKATPTEQGTGVYRVPVDQIQVDPEQYQFRSRVNQDGVDDRLSGVKKWDDNRAGQILVHRRNDGSLYVADGHHRLDLAKRLNQDSVNVRILEESDGMDVPAARVEAAMANIADGKAEALDVAKVFRDVDAPNKEIRDRFDLPRNQVALDGEALANLSDNAFGMVAAGQLSEKDGAAIGASFDDPAQQEAAVRAFQNATPKTAFERQLLVNEIKAAGFAQTQGDQGGLFGDDPEEISLLQKRLSVLDSLRQALTLDKKLFASLNKNADRASQAGNKIATKANKEITDESAKALDMINRVSTTPALSDMVNQAARRLVDGEKKATVVRDLKTELREYEQGNYQPPVSGQGQQGSAPVSSEQPAAGEGMDSGAGEPVPGDNPAGADQGGQPQGDVAPSLELEPQTEAELAEQERQQREAQEAEAQRKRDEENRIRADEQVDGFTLSGSDRPVDQAEAAGQGNMFDEPQAEPEPEAQSDQAPEQAEAERRNTLEAVELDPPEGTPYARPFELRDKQNDNAVILTGNIGEFHNWAGKPDTHPLQKAGIDTKNAGPALDIHLGREGRTPNDPDAAIQAALDFARENNLDAITLQNEVMSDKFGMLGDKQIPESVLTSNGFEKVPGNNSDWWYRALDSAPRLDEAPQRPEVTSEQRRQAASFYDGNPNEALIEAIRWDMKPSERPDWMMGNSSGKPFGTLKGAVNSAKKDTERTSRPHAAVRVRELPIDTGAVDPRRGDDPDDVKSAFGDKDVYMIVRLPEDPSLRPAVESLFSLESAGQSVGLDPDNMFYPEAAEPVEAPKPTRTARTAEDLAAITDPDERALAVVAMPEGTRLTIEGTTYAKRNGSWEVPDSLRDYGYSDSDIAGMLGQGEPETEAGPVPESTDATGKQASWVIRNKETGEVLFETFDRDKVGALNTKKYEAVPIAEHLASLNQKDSAPDLDLEPRAEAEPSRRDRVRQQVEQAKAPKPKKRSASQRRQEAIEAWLGDATTGDRITLNGDVGYAKAGREYTVGQIDGGGVEVSSGNGSTVISHSEIVGAKRNGVDVSKVRPEAEPEQQAAEEESPEQGRTKTEDYGKQNKVFTEDRAQAARDRIRKKLGQLNSGLDPELVVDGITLAGYHIEAGARKFADFANTMIEDLGEGAKPYLASWYEGVRRWPGFDSEGMTPTSEVDSFDMDRLKGEAAPQAEGWSDPEIQSMVEERVKAIEAFNQRHDGFTGNVSWKDAPEGSSAWVSVNNPARSEAEAILDPAYHNGKEFPLSQAQEATLIAALKANYRTKGDRFKLKHKVRRPLADAIMDAPMRVEARGDGRYSGDVRIHIGGGFDGFHIELGTPWPEFHSAKIVHTESGKEMARGPSSPLDLARKLSAIHYDIQRGIDPLSAGDNDDVPGSDADLERDSENAEPGDQLGADSVRDGSGADGAGAGASSGSADQRGASGQGGAGVPGGGATSGGKRGDQPTHSGDGEFGSAQGAAGSNDAGGSGQADDAGVRSESRAGQTVDDVAAAARQQKLDAEARKQAQAKTETANLSIEPGSEANIADHLPMLLPDQQGDVAFFERRLLNNKGHGVLTTNGTGTGKTFSGLGLIKRYARMGRDNILIVVPNNKIASDWKGSAQALSLDVQQLADTQDNGGTGVIVTTYANFRDNMALLERDWDLLVFDESHYLHQSNDFDPTQAENMRNALTGHPRGRFDYHRFKHAEEYEQLAELRESYEADEKIARLNDTRDEQRTRLLASADKTRAKHDALKKRLDAAKEKDEANRAELWERNGTDTLMLSATPFPYRFSVDSAEGYLFDYEQQKPGESLRYNRGDSREQFFMANFGYRMRYNKLTQPEKGVDLNLMERSFAKKLQEGGVMRSRMLEVDQDYDRRFYEVESQVGMKIDEGLTWLDQKAEATTDEDLKRGLRDLGQHIRKRFDYLSRAYFLEAVKAKEMVSTIREHLRMGRKVVVFHDFNKGGGFNPFNVTNLEPQMVPAFRLFKAERPDLQRLPLNDLVSPRVRLSKEFPDALFFNGQVPKGQRIKNADLFNDDNSGRDLIVVQSDAGREGVSMHDTTGNHQRVLINLGLPSKPIASIQTEGRIYRTFVQSNAIQRYVSTGLSLERWAIASKLAERAGTAENLAMGEQARGLKDAILEAYEMAGEYPPGHEGEGTGGKERDRALIEAISDFDRAKTYYFGTAKNTKRRDQREGKDYYATPEPLGQKMVEWADVAPNEKILEPSAGHGAILRWMPEDRNVHYLEPATDLASKAALNAPHAEYHGGGFENLNIVNKFDAVVMNPPYGQGGSTAWKHVAKAAKHLTDGGRIVALMPQGGAADKRQAAYMESDEAKQIYTVGEIELPAVTFERAGTGVRTKIVILERHTNSDNAPQPFNRSLEYVEDINEFFDEIEGMAVPERSRVQPAEQPAQPDPAASPRQSQAEGEKYATNAEFVTHVTKKGKELTGVVATELTKEEAKAFDPYTFKKDGGFFIRARHVVAADGADRSLPSFLRKSGATGRGLPRTAVQATVDRFFKRYPGADDVRVRIHDTAASLPGFNPDRDSGASIAGQYVSENDTVHLVRTAFNRPSEIRAALQEEILVHKGLGFFKPEDRQQLYRDIQAAAEQSKEVAELWDRTVKDYEGVAQGAGLSDEQANRLYAEELLGSLAQERPNWMKKGWRKLWRGIKRLLVKAGWVQPNIGTNELRSRIELIASAFERGNRAGPRSFSADIQAPAVSAFARVLRDLTDTRLSPNGEASRLKNPVTLKDGRRLSGFTDPDTQSVFYGYDQNGEVFTVRADRIDPKDVASSRDSNRTADAIREGLEAQASVPAFSRTPKGGPAANESITIENLTEQEAVNHVGGFLAKEIPYLREEIFRLQADQSDTPSLPAKRQLKKMQTDLDQHVADALFLAQKYGYETMQDFQRAYSDRNGLGVPVRNKPEPDTDPKTQNLQDRLDRAAKNIDNNLVGLLADQVEEGSSIDQAVARERDGNMEVLIEAASVAPGFNPGFITPLQEQLLEQYADRMAFELKRRVAQMVEGSTGSNIRYSMAGNDNSDGLPLPQVDVEETTNEAEAERIFREYQARRQDQSGQRPGGRENDGRAVGGRNAAPGWQSETKIRRRSDRGSQPAVIFRGSRDGLTPEDFQESRFGVSTGRPSSGLGVFFSSRRSEAAGYGDVEAFHLDLRKPYVIQGDQLPSFNSTAEATRYRNAIKAKGYDGIVVDYRNIGGQLHYIPFTPEQAIPAEKTNSRYRLNGKAKAKVLGASIRKAIQSVPELAGANIIESADQLPEKAQMQMVLEGVDPSRVRGLYVDDQLYVVAGNIESIQEGIQVAVHEAVGHKGIRGVLGKDLDAVMLRLYRSLPNTPEGRAALEEVKANYTFLDPSNRDDRIAIAEEMIAHLLEKGHRPKAWQRAVAKIRDLLRKLIPTIAWTYTDVLSLGEQAREHLRQRQAGTGEAALRYSLASRERISGGNLFDDFNDADRAAAAKMGPRSAPRRVMDAWKEATNNAGLKIRQGMVDRLAAFKAMDEQLLGERMLNEDISRSSWVLGRMANAANGALHAMLHNGRLELDPDEKVIGLKDDDSKGLGSVFAQLASHEDPDSASAEVQRFMGWIAGNRARKLLDQGRENLFSEEEISAMESWDRGTLADGRNRAEVYEQVFADFQAYRDDVLAIADQAGLLRKGMDPDDATLFMAKKHGVRGDLVERVEKARKAAARADDLEVKEMAEERESAALGELQEALVTELGMPEFDSEYDMLTTDQRELWSNEFYVPFYRISEEEQKPAGQLSTNGLSRQQAYKRLKGGTQNLNDLLENTMMNFHHLLDASLKNQAAQQAVANAQQLGMARVVPAGNRNTKTSTFVLEDGEQVYYQIDDPLVFQALTALSNAGMNNMAMKVMRGFKRLFTQMTTTTPQFMVANLIRDSLQATATNEVSKNVFANVVGGARSYKDQRVRAQMMASGASFNFGHLFGSNPDELRAQLTRDMRGAKLIDGPKAVPDALAKGWEWWTDVNNATENLNRAAIYSQNQGQGKLKAAFESRDLIDFSAHGAWPAIRILIDIVPFLNARIQGLDKIYRSGIKPGTGVLKSIFGGDEPGVTDKQAAGRFWSVTGALALAAIALYLHNEDDEEYQKLEDWQKDTYWFIRFGDQAFFIPKPFEVGAIATMAERITQQFVDDEATGKVFRERMYHMVTDTFAFSPVPQAVQPILDVYANYDAFTQRPIESMGMERLSPELRKRSSTSKAAEWISQGLNATVGALGDQETNPFALSPVQVDHLIGGYLGQVGSWAAGSGDVAWRVATGNEAPARRWYEYQPIRRFYKSLGDEDRYTRYGTVFYEGLREAGRAYSDVKELREMGRLADAAELAESKEALLRLRTPLNRAQRRLRDINRKIDVIRRADLDGELKRQQIDRLRAIKNQIQRAMGERVLEARS